MAQGRDLYAVLGLSRDATQDDIKRAFRRLARSYHPDVNRDPEAEHRFKEINLAHETLSDPAKRRQYDLYGGEGLSPDMFGFMGDIGDIFEAFFGSPFGRTRARGRTRAQRGEDLRVAVELSFEEGVFGSSREVEIERLVRCGACDGAGAAPGTSASTCSSCGGSGEVSAVRRGVFGAVMTARPCTDCGGSGERISSPCPACRGEGRVPGGGEVSVDVPAGVANGMELRVEGHGNHGRRGAPPGDLYLALVVAQHPVFARRGQDLVARLEIPVTQAMLGVDVEVDTLDGPEVLRIEPGTSTGAVYRLRGRGVPELGGRSRGDLFLEVELDVPQSLSRRERALVEQLAEVRGERSGKGRRVRGTLSPPP